MAVSRIRAEFACDVEKVWDVVTSLEEYSWRSDLGKIEILEPGRRFAEHTKDGYVTEFTITAFEPYKRYEFDMENENMKGHWIGIFSGHGGKSMIEFTEDVTAEKIFMKPFVKGYLKKQQEKYVEDLRRKLQKL